METREGRALNRKCVLRVERFSPREIMRVHQSYVYVHMHVWFDRVSGLGKEEGRRVRVVSE